MTYTFPTGDVTVTTKKRGGRPSALADMSPQMARHEADKLLVQGLSQHAWQVIELLAQSGVLSDQQLSFVAAPATLAKKYAPRRIIDRLPFSTAELEPVFREYGMPFKNDTRLYVLGPVGAELAQRRSGKPPVTGHLAYTLTRIMHDVVLNEIVMRLYRFADERGWRVSWKGTNDGALYNIDYSRKILEPDALLVFEQDGKDPLYFCVEYHNEDKRSRAERKVDKYEAVRTNNEKLWRTQWETDRFPHVLAVFAKRIVGEGYRDKIKTVPVGVQFYGKLLSGVLQDNLEEWANFTTGKREKIFPV